MKNLKMQISIGFVCVVLGFFIMVQLKSVGKNSVTTYPNQVRLEQLQELLRLEKEKTETLYKQVMEQKDEIAAYQERAINDDSLVDVLKADLKKNEIMAGTVPVEGAGIEIILQDGEITNPLNVDENVYIVHDDDVLMVLNELKAAGAEAISVNNQRLVSTSEIRCAGNTISVNNTRTAAPFVIRAIGDPQQLESGLTMLGGAVDKLSRWVKIELRRKDAIVLPAYTGSTTFQFAKIITNAEAAEKVTKKGE